MPFADNKSTKMRVANCRIISKNNTEEKCDYQVIFLS